MKTHLWALYRRLRTSLFRAAGRNPFHFSASYRDELEAVRVLRQVAANPPRALRTEGDLVQWETPVGNMWAPRRADATFMGMLSVEHLLGVYRYTARPGDVVIDCGGNIGMFSLPAARNGAALVIAFEPCPENIPAFRRNLEPWIQSGAVRLFECGVWSEPSTLYLQHAPSANPGSPAVTTTRSEHTIPVPLTTIDIVAGELGLSRLDFLKMDIEGAEVAALTGARETLRRFHPPIGLGTEHTEDILTNNQKVLEIIRAIEPSYSAIPTEVHAARGRNGWSLTPHSLYVAPAERAMSASASR